MYEVVPSLFLLYVNKLLSIEVVGLIKTFFFSLIFLKLLADRPFVEFRLAKDFISVVEEAER